MFDVGGSRSVLYLEGLLGVDLDGVVFSWTVEPFVSYNNLEDISSRVRGQKDWVRELVGDILVGSV